MSKEENEKPVLCSCDGENYTYCLGMDKYLEANDTRKGIRMLGTLMNLETGVSYQLGPYYKSGAKDPGMLFNFCPWCGSDLEENWRKPVRAWVDKRNAEVRAELEEKALRRALGSSFGAHLEDDKPAPVKKRRKRANKKS